MVIYHHLLGYIMHDIEARMGFCYHNPWMIVKDSRTEIEDKMCRLGLGTTQSRENKHIRDIKLDFIVQTIMHTEIWIFSLSF